MVQNSREPLGACLRANTLACQQNRNAKCGQRPAGWIAGIVSTGRLSRAGLNSTGLDFVHSSHQWRCALSRRFLAPQ
jgi:hypothetical protein